MDYNIVFRLVDKACDIHLGVADKLLLKNHLEEFVGRGCDDYPGIFKLTRIFLTDMSYTSKRLTELTKKQKKFEKDFADYVLERYKK